MAWIRGWKGAQCKFEPASWGDCEVAALHPASGRPLSSDRREWFPFGVSRSIEKREGGLRVHIIIYRPRQFQNENPSLLIVARRNMKRGALLLFRMWTITVVAGNCWLEAVYKKVFRSAFLFCCPSLM